MTKVYLSLKKRVFLGISAFIGLLMPFIGGSRTPEVSADTPIANQYSPDGPCPDPACCSPDGPGGGDGPSPSPGGGDGPDGPSPGADGF